MILFDWEWYEMCESFGDFSYRYQSFAPDIWRIEKDHEYYGFYCTAVQDLEADWDKEIINVVIIPRQQVRYMWE